MKLPEGWAESLRRIAALIRRELLTIWRDKRGRSILILPPIMQLFVFSYAATFDLREAPIAILNEDAGLASRELVARFSASDAFKPVARLTNSAEIPAMIEDAKALAVLHIGPTFSRTRKVDAIPGRPLSRKSTMCEWVPTATISSAPRS